MKIKVPATSANLSAGFDCLGLAIKLYNEVIVKPSSLQIVSIKGEGEDRPHMKRKNPFVSIFHETILELTGRSDNYRFEFINKIPFSRGLGSSSAVIVGAIASAYKMAGLKVDKQAVLNRALLYENHPDNIAPAVYGGFTASIVHGKRVVVQKKALPEDLCSVVVIPNEPMSTAKSRTLLPKQYKMCDIVWNISHSSFLSAAFMREDWDLLKLAAQDALHEEKRMGQMPILFDVRRVSYENGSLMSTLSGSGSTFFNLSYKKDAKRLENALKESFKDFRVEVFDVDNDGFLIQDI
ncbi:MAG: homoserine kinase [Proteobacteria bacterium]|nr:MAG: homoserine kinase [Pseudomonadota bacterium]